MPSTKSLSEIIRELQTIETEHGDLPVLLGAHSFEFGGVTNIVDTIEVSCHRGHATGVRICGLEE